MKILIIGDNPQVTGGVCNYTRPLFLELEKNNVQVMYLYSSSRLKADYRLFGKTQIVNDKTWKNNNVFKIINSQNLDMNYDHLEYDTKSDKNDKVFERFIKTHNPDIMHINEMIGFSSNIINIAKKHNIKTIITVHEYWWLCPKRVMVDFNRKICIGPSNLDKCTHCITEVSKNYNSSKRKTSYMIRNQFGTAHKFLSDMKYKFKKQTIHNLENLNFGNDEIHYPIDSKLKQSLSNRLRENIHNLNQSDVIISVSNDVRNHLLAYGVDNNKIIVQHIGSTIADKSIHHKKNVQREKIIFGFIGGVSYYKGVHQIVDAYLQMPNEYKAKSELKIFGGFNSSYVESIKVNIIKNSIYAENINFYGRYVAQDIEKITNELDINILSSLCADTAPQTIFESFSSGLPIIAPNIGGFPDFIQDEYNGLLYDAGSVESLKEKLMLLIEEPARITFMGKNISKMKSIVENTQELISMYTETLSKLG